MYYISWNLCIFFLLNFKSDLGITGMFQDRLIRLNQWKICCAYFSHNYQRTLQRQWIDMEYIDI